MLTSYKQMPIWDEIPKLYPARCQINETIKPEEIYWEWKNNKIHLDYYPNSQSKVKIILLHGVGGNGRLLSFIAVPLARVGFEVIAPDLPGYGLSQIKGIVSYEDWVQMVNDLIDKELSKDDREIFLFGLSAGGMLAYHSASKSKKVAGIIATNLLDQRLQEVRDGSAHNKIVSRIGTPLLRLLAKINDKIKLPMKSITKMKAIVNDKRILELLLKDKSSSGTSVSLKLIISILDAKYEIEPEDFDLCPVLLIHPGNDKWTPIRLSKIFYDRLKVNKKLYIIKGAGHFPIEPEAIGQIEKEVIDFINKS